MRKTAIQKVIYTLMQELAPLVSYEERIQIYQIVDDLEHLAEENLVSNTDYNPFDMKGYYVQQQQN